MLKRLAIRSSLMGTTSIDERGRVLIPRDVRKEFGFAPDRPVVWERVEGGILLRPALPMKEALRRLRGAIGPDTRRGRMDPLRLKDMWTKDLPR